MTHCHPWTFRGNQDGHQNEKLKLCFKATILLSVGGNERYNIHVAFAVHSKPFSLLYLEKQLKDIEIIKILLHLRKYFSTKVYLYLIELSTYN